MIQMIENLITRMIDIFIECKYQICCFMILFYIGYRFIRDGNRLDKLSRKKNCNTYYDILFVLGEISVFLDGVTVYTVNRSMQIPLWVNGVLHYFYFATYELFLVVLFQYWLSVGDKLPRQWWKKMLYYGPCVISLAITAFLMPKLQYVQGKHTYYSMGLAVYLCFGMISIYMLMTVILAFRNRTYIKKNQKNSLLASMIGLVGVIVLQCLIPELLISSIGVMMVLISIYLGMENPAVKTVEVYHEEMLLGFSSLLEKKDGGTGAHIRRTSQYAVLIARQLGKMPKYKKRINRDYINEIQKAAPMHDIGKMAIPDSILQKPGKLTEEEFAIMKTHSEEGANIIAESFRHLVEDEENGMPYKVAYYHHEKWNGKGYPKGLAGEEIPLSARIMAVADVFDAVSMKRCYRDALPLEECFKIIENGRGTDFDPDVVDAFLERRKDVTGIYEELKEA